VRHTTADGDGRRALARSALALSMTGCLVLGGPSPDLELADAGPVSAQLPTTTAASTPAAALSAPSIRVPRVVGAESYPAFTAYPVHAPPSVGSTTYPVASALAPPSGGPPSRRSDVSPAPVHGPSDGQDPPRERPDPPGATDSPAASPAVPTEPEPPTAPELPADADLPAVLPPAVPSRPDPPSEPVTPGPPPRTEPAGPTTGGPGGDELDLSPEALLLHAAALAEAWSLRPARDASVSDEAAWDSAMALGWWWGLVESCVISPSAEPDRCILAADELMRGLDVPAAEPERWDEVEPLPRDLGYLTVLRVLGRAAEGAAAEEPVAPPRLPSRLGERRAVEP
jgi:hypothetical protein